MLVTRLNLKIKACLEHRGKLEREELQKALDEAIKAGVDPRDRDVRYAKVILRDDFDPQHADEITAFYRAGLHASGARPA